MGAGRGTGHATSCCGLNKRHTQRVSPEDLRTRYTRARQYKLRFLRESDVALTPRTFDFQRGRCKKCEMNPMKAQRGNKGELLHVVSVTKTAHGAARALFLFQCCEDFHFFFKECLDFILFIFLCRASNFAAPQIPAGTTK